jgi:hypothetical protein
VRQLGRILDRRDLELLVADGDHVTLDLHVHVQRAVDRVVFQQVDVCLHRPEIVHGDDFDVRALVFQNGTENQTTDPAKTVDRDTHSHCKNPRIFRCRTGCKKDARPARPKPTALWRA